MKLQRVFEKLSDLSEKRVIPQGIIDEGRIFHLGMFENEDHLHGRVTDVVEGLKDHVGQPFEFHPWSFVFDVSTVKQDAVTAPITLVGVVWPQQDGSVFVQDFIALPKGLRRMKHFLFNHTPNGTLVTVPNSGDSQEEKEDSAAGSLYPLAIAVLNTRGCRVDLKRAPAIKNAKLKRQGKHTTPAHYHVDATEYFSALGASAHASNRGGTHASPIPHLRRAHERVLASGERIWIPSSLINVRNEGDIAFVERRKAYHGVEK